MAGFLSLVMLFLSRGDKKSSFFHANDDIRSVVLKIEELSDRGVG